MSAHILHNLQGYAEHLVEAYQVPAVSIAIWHKNTLHKAAAGVLNINTQIEATSDSVFQIGSITKVFTASLVMRLVESGRVELDRPVKYYVRDFRVAEPEATQSITVRQLLCHISGIDGDLCPDNPHEMGNPIARYVDRCNLVPQVHEPGRGFSYSNASYVVAGRLVEIVLGLSFFEAVEEHIYKPLGMEYSVGHPMNTLRYRAAMGHFSNPENPAQLKLAPICYASMGLAPAGRLTMSASDLILFAKAHMDKGRSECGQQWLSPDTVAAMQETQVTLPPHSPSQVTGWGLGWCLVDKVNRASVPIIGHSGQTFGQSAMLRLLPKQNSAFAVLTNIGGGGILGQVFGDLLSELADIKFKKPQILNTTYKSERFVGQFESLGYRYHITLKNQQLTAMVKDKVLLTSETKLLLKPIDKNTFASYSGKGKFAGNIIFLNFDDFGVPTSLFAGYRLINRVR